MNLTELNSQIIECRKCPRLVEWREKVSREKRRAYIDQEYWAKPVPGFGDPKARVFIIGLAPGAHGSNRTGRQFTGDSSGDFLFQALYQAGFASQPISSSRTDGLTLRDAYTAPVCRCVPPQNKPTMDELLNCQMFLEKEIEIIQPKIFVALGRIAFDAIVRICSQKNQISIYQERNDPMVFAHNNVIRLNSKNWIISSYHPSRQNTQTGRLTVEMFDEIWNSAGRLLKQEWL